jgi:hypothetical protein
MDGLREPMDVRAFAYGVVIGWACALLYALAVLS